MMSALVEPQTRLVSVSAVQRICLERLDLLRSWNGLCAGNLGERALNRAVISTSGLLLGARHGI